MKSRVRTTYTTGGNNIHHLPQGSGRSVLQHAGHRTLTPRGGNTPVVHSVDPHAQHTLTHTYGTNHPQEHHGPQVYTVHQHPVTNADAASNTAALAAQYHRIMDEDYAHAATSRQQRYEGSRNSGVPTPKVSSKSSNPSSNVLNRRVKAILAGLRSRFFHAKGSMRQTFRSWDTNANGTLDAGEIQEALSAMGYGVTTEEARGIIKAFDGNADGVVQYEDFVSLLCGNDNDAIAVTASDGQVSFIRGGAAPGDINTGVTPTATYAGMKLKKTLGTQEVAYRRNTSVYDVADGRGSDTLAESIRLMKDRENDDMRLQFTRTVSEQAAQQYSTALAKESGLGFETYRSSEDDNNNGSDNAPAAEIDYSTLAHLGPASEAALVSSGFIPTLPLNTLRKTTSNEPTINKRIPHEFQPRQRTLDLSLTARSKIPRETEALTGPMSLVDHEPDPLAAVPDTGRGTIVVGTIGGDSNRSTLQQIVNKSIAKVHRTAPGPLEHMFPSNPVPKNTVREERYRNRQLDWQQRTGIINMNNYHHHNSNSSLPSGATTPSSVTNANNNSLPSLPLNIPVASSSSSNAPTSVNNSSSLTSTYSNNNNPQNTTTWGGETKMADKIRKAREDKLARLGLDSVNSTATGAGGAVFGHVAAANDVRQRMVRAEGQRTSYLIAPPPTVFTSHSAENPEWHYASIARIQQTGRKIPEQFFDSIIGADRTKNIQTALADYTARVEGNIAGDLEMQRLSQESRVEAKRTLRNSYREAVSRRLAKEAIIFGGDEPLQVQW